MENLLIEIRDLSCYVFHFAKQLFVSFHFVLQFLKFLFELFQFLESELKTICVSKKRKIFDYFLPSSKFEPQNLIN